jgi:hypothetical protein
MCELKVATSQGVCDYSDGGIYQTEIASLYDITDVVFDVNGRVTNFVMASLGKWFEYIYDDDDTAYYNQTGTRENKKSNKEQVAFFKYAGITEEMIDFADALDGCCAVAAIHRTNSQIAMLQGIDYVGGSQVWLPSKKKCTANISILTGTGAEEDRVEVTLNSTGRKFSRPVLLTSAEIAEL